MAKDCCQRPRVFKRHCAAQGEIRHALEYMGPKYTALLQIGVESGSKFKSTPPPSKELIQQGLVGYLSATRSANGIHWVLFFVILFVTSNKIYDLVLRFLERPTAAVNRDQSAASAGFSAID